MEDFEQTLCHALNFSYIHHDRLYIDVAKETCPSNNIDPLLLAIGKLNHKHTYGTAAALSIIVSGFMMGKSESPVKITPTCSMLHRWHDHFNHSTLTPARRR
jgi:hypothetical protein